MLHQKAKNIIQPKKWIEEGLSPTGVIGLSGSALSYYLALLLDDLEKPCLIILPRSSQADRLSRELRFFLSSKKDSPKDIKRIYDFPPYDISPLTGLGPHRELVAWRIQSLYALLSQENPIVITSLEAVFSKIIPKVSFVKSLEYLEVGEEIERDFLIGKFETSGYQRSSLVEEIGDYSIRGGVIDIFPPLYEFPVRLEFWGDSLESIRLFDPISQRSKAQRKDVVLLPANEIIMDSENIERARSMGRLPKRHDDNMTFPGQEAWLNHFYPSLDTLFQYLPENGLLISIDSHRTESIGKKLNEKFQKDIARFGQEAAERGNPFPETDGVLLSPEELNLNLKNRQRLDIGELDLAGEDYFRKKLIIDSHLHLEDDLELSSAERGTISMAPLAEKISGWLDSRAKVVIVSRTKQQANRLNEIMKNYEVASGSIMKRWADVPPGPGLSICLGRLSKGFTWPDLGIYVISEDEIFGPKKGRSKQRKRRGKGGITWSDFSQLKVGDLVVHEDHGIGKYGGLVKMEIENKTNDFVIVDYAKTDRLYIPADRISILQKYVGAEDGSVKLDLLGGRSWNLAKKKAKKSVKAIAKQLIQIYALRAYRKGFSFSPPDNYFREFEASFEHEETPDQIKAIDDVLEDMASESPMDRLICGDVGFGKTEVALRAAFKAVSDGKQVAILVPTTVLAEQHYETFKKRMASYSICVGILSRFKTKSEQVETLGRVRSNEIQILIGTHRILQKDVSFKNLGLLIIDEEQRFGVKQKETLKKYRALLDVLSITATPIPRTLRMAMMGVRDISIIETPPEERLAIQTHLSPFDNAIIKRAIELELKRKGQVFFVHNKVQSIDHIAHQLTDLVPEARFAIAHGQMKERELEKTMIHFLSKKIDVLVCTTIIEAGLDIPSANTIIINEVERLGLAQVYQLRGRVGRAKEKAYAYLLLSKSTGVTRDAEKRLKALMDFTHLGAGLHLAMHDLRIRGGGNALGYAQSGQISAIGYELYVKLIEQAIAELKGEEWQEDINPEINVDIPAFLPGDYVIDSDIRLNLYRRLSGIDSELEFEEMVEEITDRFGPPPKEVNNLLELMVIRLRLKIMGITRLDVGQASLTLTYSSNAVTDRTKLIELITQQKNKYRFLSQKKLKVFVGKLSLPQDFPRIQSNLEVLDV